MAAFSFNNPLVVRKPRLTIPCVKLKEQTEIGDGDFQMLGQARLLFNICFFASFACSSTAALAGSATTTWTAYLYQGPGTHYAVVDEVPQETHLDVEACQGGWCKVISGRRIGYLRAEVVARTDATHPAPGVLPQPAAALSPSPPPGPCVEANQTGGNGGNALTIFCRR